MILFCCAFPIERKYGHAKFGTIPLAQLAISHGFHDQGQMGKLGHGIFPAKSLIQQNMMCCARQPLLAPNYVGDFHQVVINDVSQMIRRHPIRFEQYLVVYVGTLKNNFAPNQIMNSNFLIGFYLQTNYIRQTRIKVLLHGLCRKGQAIAQTRSCKLVIGKIIFAFPTSLQCFGRIKGIISMPPLHQLQGIIEVNGLAITLTVGTIITPKTNAFIGYQAHPF